MTRTLRISHENQLVYKLEVHREHVYRVGDSGTLVHNTYSGLIAKYYKYTESVGVNNVRRLFNGRIRYYE
ncbi:MAG: hypothetical protein R3C11_00840 [Planctomycetaceae bacterium]